MAAHTVSIGSGPTLSQRLADHARRLIVGSAADLLEHASPPQLTVRAVAARARVAERTVFRHFATREALLDAVAEEVVERLELPPDPLTIGELQAYPGKLYRRFEAKAGLARAALHSELFPRIRDARAKQRWASVRRLIDAHAPSRTEHERKLAAANICYYLSATTWHYYRFSFGFGLSDTIACAEAAVRQALAQLGAGRAPGSRGARVRAAAD